MSVDGPRNSIFIFQSSVHSHRVLWSLEQLRQKDQLCDLTVEVESRSFRAHASVLASCSHYFYSTLTNNSTGHFTISLPHEVTVEGFEPLLQFAYTAKLHFTKENILEIQRCAKFLGFQNLDEACFEFLVPKFSEGGMKRKSKAHLSQEKPQPIPALTDQNSQVEDLALVGCNTRAGPPPSPGKSHQECSTNSVEKEMQKHLTPLYSKTVNQMNDGHEQFCLENCGPQLPSSSMVLEQVCPFLTTSSEGDKLDSSGLVCGMGDISITKDVFQEELAKNALGEAPSGNMPNLASGTFEHDSTLMPPSTIIQLCPLNSELELDEISSDPDPNIINTNSQVFKCSEQTFHDLTPKHSTSERSTVEREVAEHLAKGFWLDLSSNLNEPLPLDSTDPVSAGKVPEFNWLKDLDLGAAPDECPFLRELGTSDQQSSGGDTVSREDTGDSTWMSPTNSRENSECDSDEDCEQCESGVQVPEVDLPFPVEQISSMTRRGFLQMLKREHLTPEQLEFVQDIRRRSKNRVAAQRCRKRKLDCIYRLEGDINKLKAEKEKLLHERSQLKFGMEEASQKFSGLCQSLSLDTASIILSPSSLAGPDVDTHTDISLDTILSGVSPEGDTVALRSTDKNTVTDPAL